MKTFITALLMLFSLIAGAQNGGQFFENNVILIEYVGYFNGQHTFKVHNKQSCEARIRTKAEQDAAIDVQVPSNSYVLVHIARPTPVGILFRAKAETSCISNPDMGWLEINTSLISLSLNDEVIQRVNELRKDINVVYSEGHLKVTTNNSLNYLQTVTVFDPSGSRRYYKTFTMSKGSVLYLHDQIRLGLNFISVRLDRNGIVYQYLIRIFY